MNILFICGSAEPGKDGVGDYTRRLCGELLCTGHKIRILALCDNHSTSFTNNKQFAEGSVIIVHRIPVTSSFKQRILWTQDILKEFQPDWISLQFVPYSFNPKGLPFWLPLFLKKLQGKHRWHIMFHELWVGLEREARFKNKCVGLLQKRIIRKLEKSLTPTVVHTQSKIYQFYLSKIGVKATYLPLFGNVAVTATKENNSDYMIFVVFATIHDKSPFQNFVSDLKKVAKHTNKSLKFVFIGRNGGSLDSWISTLVQNEIEYELIGASTENKISQVLINADFGISSTPYKISDKSGVVAAFREHHLPIISVAKAWIDIEDIAMAFNDIIHYQKGVVNLHQYLEKENNSLSRVCGIFLKSLENN